MTTEADASIHKLARPSRLVPAVVESLVDRIHREGLRPGQLIPREALLCEQYGVSRTVIREALSVLEEKGMVDIRQGHGTTVTSPEEWNLLDQVVIAAQIKYDPTVTGRLSQLVHMRAALEAEMTRDAARTMHRAERAELTAMLATMGTRLDKPGKYLSLDRAFHMLIMQSSGNDFACHVVRTAHRWSQYGPQWAVSRDHLIASHRGHTAIHDHVINRAPDEAAKAMRAHILDAWAVKKQALEEAQEPVRKPASETA